MASKVSRKEREAWNNIALKTAVLDTVKDAAHEADEVYTSLRVKYDSEVKTPGVPIAKLLDMRRLLDEEENKKNVLEKRKTVLEAELHKEMAKFRTRDPAPVIVTKTCDINALALFRKTQGVVLEAKLSDRIKREKEKKALHEIGSTLGFDFGNAPQAPLVQPLNANPMLERPNQQDENSNPALSHAPALAHESHLNPEDNPAPSPAPALSPTLAPESDLNAALSPAPAPERDFNPEDKRPTKIRRVNTI
ncbi:hypothetical protein LguiB_010113 [Lonicera macranthoides]